MMVEDPEEELWDLLTCHRSVFRLQFRLKQSSPEGSASADDAKCVCVCVEGKRERERERERKRERERRRQRQRERQLIFNPKPNR